MKFQKNRSIADHDAVIWLGDFNYRIGLGNPSVRELILQRDYQKLYDNDQVSQTNCVLPDVGLTTTVESTDGSGQGVPVLFRRPN